MMLGAGNTGTRTRKSMEAIARKMGLIRLAYRLMTLLSVALGLSFAVAVAGIDVSRQPPLELAYSLKLLLRAASSFVAGCAFAMAFNTPVRIALAAGLLTLIANSLRLALIDTGIMLAPAAFCAVITMPGVHAFEAIVLFNHGQMVEALQASASCWFVIGALAMGLATAQI